MKDWKSKIVALALIAAGLFIGLHRAPSTPATELISSRASEAMTHAEAPAPAVETIDAGVSSDQGLLGQDDAAATEHDAQTPVAAIKEHPFPGVVSGGPGGYTPPQPVAHTFRRGTANACLTCGQGIEHAAHPVVQGPAAVPQTYQYQRRPLLRWRGR